MPFIDDPNLPQPDRRLELAVQIAEQAIRIAERLLAENAELKRCRGRTPRRTERTKQPLTR
jgi:hypothetical protein